MYWSALFARMLGPTAFALRLSSAYLSTLGLCATWALARRMLGRLEAGVALGASSMRSIGSLQLRAPTVEAASQDMSWKAVHRYSQDYSEMQTKDKVRFFKTPDAILQQQLSAYDAAAAKRKDNAIFNEIAESQKKFAERAVRWDLDTNVNRRMAYNHYFGKKPAAAKKG